MSDVPQPKLPGHTNGDLIQHIIDLRLALEKCNDQKQLMRDWAVEASK